jgi:hypothetical protein
LSSAVVATSTLLPLADTRLRSSRRQRLQPQPHRRHRPQHDPTINNYVSSIWPTRSRCSSTRPTRTSARPVCQPRRGPFPGNPNHPQNQNFLFRVPRSPAAQNGNHTGTSLGPIGFMVNGVAFFNASDGHSYNNLASGTRTPTSSRRQLRRGHGPPAAVRGLPLSPAAGVAAAAARRRRDAPLAAAGVRV